MIYVEMIGTAYFLGFLYNYLGLRHFILDQFSELGWHVHRFKVLRRALIWFVPGSVYYWKDAKWAKESKRFEPDQ